MESYNLLNNDDEHHEINKVYDECLNYLKQYREMYPALGNKNEDIRKDIDIDMSDPGYETIIDVKEDIIKINHIQNGNTVKHKNATTENHINDTGTDFKVENEVKVLSDSANSLEMKSVRLEKLSQKLPKIIITQSSTSLNMKQANFELGEPDDETVVLRKKSRPSVNHNKRMSLRRGYGEFPKRLVSKSGMENIAVISNVPFGKIRLLNDTFHTLINLRWRWIVTGTIILHFTIWLVFAVFWYITALAHYDFEPNPPNKTCVTGGKDFVTIFLASVEAQTTIGFGDRAIDEECPESIFLFITQLILGTGLSGVLTCVVYAKLTRPEKLSRDGVGFSRKAVISLRDGHMCLMIRAWDLNHDHIISSEFNAHFVNTHRTKEGEMVRYFARNLALQQRQFLLWPVTLVHVIDENSPLYDFTPDSASNQSYEITVSLKGASASMGTFTQSQTSYVPREIIWGHRFPPVVKYDNRKQKYVIDDKKLDATEPVDTPYCSARRYNRILNGNTETLETPSRQSSFSEKISSFQLERSSSFKRKSNKI